MTRNFEILKVDPFTHTFNGAPWVNLEWLTHVLFFNVYDHLGENWITYLRIGLILLIFAVSLRFCLIRSRSWLISLLTVALGAWICQPILDARAQLFTFLYANLVLLILHEYRRRGRDLLPLLPVILLVWTQQHFGYVFGLLLLLGNLVAESGKRLLHLPADPLTWKQIRGLVIATVLSAVAVAINPWTFEAFSEPLSLLEIGGGSNPWMQIEEMRPPRFLAAEPFNPPQFWIFLGLVALVCLPMAIAAWRSFDFNDVGLAAVLASGFALQHRRFIPLFAILTLPLLSYGLRFWVDWWLARSEEPRVEAGASSPSRAAWRLRQGALAVGVASWLLLLILVPLRLRTLAQHYSDRSLFSANAGVDFFPSHAVEFLREIRIPGLMYNVYGWGGYLDFFLPEHPTFIDGRAFLIFDERFYRQYRATRRGWKGWKRFLDRHGVTFALIHLRRDALLLQAMIDDPDWTWIYGRDTSAVLLRESPVNRELLDRFDARELPLPDIGISYFIYGRRASERQDHEQAVRDFATASERSPERDVYRAYLIQALALAGRPEEARREARRALVDFPDSEVIKRLVRPDPLPGQAGEI
jgi:hypothetical protein